MEAMDQRVHRMRMNYWDFCEKGGEEYSDDHRNDMLEILEDPTNFSDEEKIETLLSFHKDTCANFLLGLYPSADVASQDLEILKGCVAILKYLNNKHQLMILQPAILEDLRAKKQLFQMKTAMSIYLKSRHSPLLNKKDFKEWMLENSQFEDDVDYHDDDERLESIDKEISSVLANLQSLGADTSNYQDVYLNFKISDPKATMSKYKLLDDIAKNTSEEAFRLLEDEYPFELLIDLERQVKMLENDFAQNASACCLKAAALHLKKEEPFQN